MVAGRGPCGPEGERGRFMFVFLSCRVEVSERETGAAHGRPRAAAVPGGRAGVHSMFPGAEGPAESPRQPLHLWGAGDGQDGLPELRPAGDEGTARAGA